MGSYVGAQLLDDPCQSSCWSIRNGYKKGCNRGTLNEEIVFCEPFTVGPDDVFDDVTWHQTHFRSWFNNNNNIYYKRQTYYNGSYADRIDRALQQRDRKQYTIKMLHNENIFQAGTGLWVQISLAALYKPVLNTPFGRVVGRYKGGGAISINPAWVKEIPPSAHSFGADKGGLCPWHPYI